MAPEYAPSVKKIFKSWCESLKRNNKEFLISLLFPQNGATNSFKNINICNRTSQEIFFFKNYAENKAG